jgi:pseudaminic acid biosynthesis-associated methylase
MLNEQESFWIGNFGNEYTLRNDKSLIKNKEYFFKNILKNIEIDSIFEIGCNSGLNLESIKNINPSIELNGLEINEYAYNIVRNKHLCNNIYNTSISELDISKNNTKYALVFTMGVLIHINPEMLTDTYKKMYEMSNKYILIGEYYSKTPQGISYRGFNNKLFKRDFCSEIMNLYNNLELIDYGFTYHNDPHHPLDDVTWFLLKKH